MIIGAYSYADFVLVAKKLANNVGVFYSFTAPGNGENGYMASFIENGQSAVNTFFQFGGVPTESQILADFPNAIAIGNILSLTG